MSNEPKYYTVEDMGPGTVFPRWRWLVTGWWGKQLMQQTGHHTEVSVRMECKAWESRGYVRRNLNDRP